MKREVQTTSTMIADQQLVDALAAAGALMEEGQKPEVFLSFMLDLPSFDKDSEVQTLRREMEQMFKQPKRLLAKAALCGYVLVRPYQKESWFIKVGNKARQPALALLRKDVAAGLTDEERSERVRDRAQAAAERVAARYAEWRRPAAEAGA